MLILDWLVKIEEPRKMPIAVKILSKMGAGIVEQVPHIFSSPSAGHTETILEWTPLAAEGTSLHFVLL